MAAQKNRRKCKNNTVLLGLIALLSALLLAAVIIALSLPDRSSASAQPTPPDTEPTPSAGTSPTETQPPLDGWQAIDGARYYYKNGIPYTGWLVWEGNRYYLQPDGKMSVGIVEIEGVNHFFSAGGVFFHVVNPWNYVPADYEMELVSLPKQYGDGQQVDSTCYDALLQMIDDCNAAMAGKTQAYVVSGYRSIQRQTNNFNNKVNRLMAEDTSLSRAEAEKIAATVIAIPGTSEHHLGLAVDIIDTDLWALEEEQEDLPAQKWLMENCWRYGFLLRYPKGTTDSTGIIYEPWHYRYLGVELATEIHNSGMTVEQYLQSLTPATAGQ